MKQSNFSVKKIIIISVISLSIILLIFILFILWQARNTEKTNCKVDELSGETICETEYEEEASADIPTTFIGLAFLDENGFSNPQQDSILSFLKEYFSKYSSITYKKGSFNYDPVTQDDVEDFSKSHFELISDTSESFIIHLDTKGSIKSVSISVENNKSN